MEIKTTQNIFDDELDCGIEDYQDFKDIKWVKVEDVKELIDNFHTNNRTQRNILKKLKNELSQK